MGLVGCDDLNDDGLNFEGGMCKRPKVEPMGLPCFDVEHEEDEVVALREDDDGEEAGGLVTGSLFNMPTLPPSPLSSEDECSEA